MTPKPHFTLLTGDEAQALMALGKYREDKPHWVFSSGQTWALVNEAFTAWRAARAILGNRGKAT